MRHGSLRRHRPLHRESLGGPWLGAISSADLCFLASSRNLSAKEPLPSRVFSATHYSQRCLMRFSQHHSKHEADNCLSKSFSKFTKHWEKGKAAIVADERREWSAQTQVLYELIDKLRASAKDCRPTTR